MSLNRHFMACIFTITCVAAYAQNTPDITLHSENYELYGDDNLFTLALGATVEGQIGVDCGSGIVNYDIKPATYDALLGYTKATYVPCTTTSRGIVKIYCYGDVAIDYFNADGCGLTSVEFASPESLDILSLRHNSLRALDLSAMCNVTSVDVGDNPYTDAPLIVGGNKPNLQILNIDIIENMDQSFSLTDYPALVAFDAYDNYSLFTCDPSQCPNLVKLSIDDTPVSTLDVSQNPELKILNVGGTDIRNIDVTNNTKLQQLFCQALGKIDQKDRLSHIDISNCPDLIYFFCSNNALTEIDLSHNPLLRDISLGNNFLTEIDLSHNPNLMNVGIENNYMSFANLPSDPGWLDYKYYQRPIVVPESYLIGTPIDLSDRLLRPGTETSAVVYAVNPENPTDFRILGSDEFTFDAGVLTINNKTEGEVYAEFYNSELNLYPMTTTKFKVKDSDSFGKNEFAFSLVPTDTSAALAMSIGMANASEEHPKYFYIGLGDGELIECIATTDTIPATPNFTCPSSASLVNIFVEENGVLAALGISDVALSAINLSSARDIKYLSLDQTQLSEIDLSYNNKLVTLNLCSNDFSKGFSLAGYDGSYNKNSLSEIYLSNNHISAINLMVPEVIRVLDLSHNDISDLNLTDAENIVKLNVSYNELEFLRLSYQSSLKYFDASHNRLSQIVLPETNVIESIDLSDNEFGFASLPVPGEGTGSLYRYSPQAQIDITRMGMGCNLSSQYVTVKGNTTAYRWLTVDGDMLTPGSDYTVYEGITRFAESTIGMTLYCEISNASFPDLIITTTPITSAGMPEYVVGEFTTTRDGQTVSLSLGSAHDNSSIYIDWEGNGTLSEYLLKTSYTLFTAKTTADARVKVYSYEPGSDLTIFSVHNAKMKDVDLSGMTRLTCLSIDNAGISDLIMPDSPDLRELYMINNQFSQFDFASYPNISALSFEHNNFTEVDLTPLKALEMVNFSNNKLKSVTLGEKPYLWALHFTANSIESIDLSACPMAYQITLDHNKLTHIDVNNLNDLHVLYLDYNNFTFASLPEPREQWTVYYYANQAPIEVVAVDGVVDISSQAVINGVPSSFTWLRGMPWLDSSTGELMGNLLTEGDDYVVDGGITTFYADVDNAVCLILNELFPRAYLYTPEIAVTAAGLTDAMVPMPVIKVRDTDLVISAAPAATVTVFTTDGRLVATALCNASGTCTLTAMPKGALIVKIGSQVTKVLMR